MCVCAGTSGEAAADNPLRLVGRMILQQSYICALIAMMVKHRISSVHPCVCDACDANIFALLPPAGVEYNVPQLADVCAAAVVVSDLDAAGASTLRCPLLSLHPAVWLGSLLPAVCVGHGARNRAAPAHRHHEPAPAGSGSSTLPLFALGSHGEDTEALANVLFAIII